MKNNRHSYPHPVLNCRDDISGSLKCTLQWNADADYFYLRPIFNLSNAYITGLVKEGKAQFTVHLHCPQTLFRESYNFSIGDSILIKITSEKLRDEVEIEFFVTAAQIINDYRCDMFHPDYSEVIFRVEKNSVIALGGRATFFAEKKYDSLNSVSSIMQIEMGSSKSGPAEIDFSGDKIVIWLCITDYENYKLYKKNKHSSKLLHASIVLPVLMDALRKIKEDSSVTGTRWYKVVRKRIENEKLDHDDYFRTAQILLSLPISRAFNGMEELLNVEIDNE